MNVIMSPLWAVDLVLILAPVVTAILGAVRRRRNGEPVEAPLVRAVPELSRGGGGGVWLPRALVPAITASGGGRAICRPLRPPQCFNFVGEVVHHRACAAGSCCLGGEREHPPPVFHFFCEVITCAVDSCCLGGERERPRTGGRRASLFFSVASAAAVAMRRASLQGNMVRVRRSVLRLMRRARHRFLSAFEVIVLERCWRLLPRRIKS